MTDEPVPPYLQPAKPKKFYELLDECIVVAHAHNDPRKWVRRRFIEDAYERIFHT